MSSHNESYFRGGYVPGMGMSLPGASGPGIVSGSVDLPNEENRMSDIVRVSFTVEEANAVLGTLGADYPSPAKASAFAKLRKAVENPLNGPTFVFSSRSDVEIPLVQTDKEKGYPFRLGALSMAARLYLTTGHPEDRRLLIRLTNAEFDPAIHPPISDSARERAEQDESEEQACRVRDAERPEWDQSVADGAFEDDKVGREG